MPLHAGQRIGQYEVVCGIGAGGMGEVYRAHDTKLRRDVALQILPEAFAADPDRLSRFEREAQVLASLNHVNIAGIYGLEESDGAKALALELVEGPTLDKRIRRPEGLRLPDAGTPCLQGDGGGRPSGFPIDEALSIARQIVDALEAAQRGSASDRPGSASLVAVSSCPALRGEKT